MSTAAEKSAARRAKILAKAGSRMAIVTQGMSASALPDNDENMAVKPVNATAPLSAEKAAEELEKALEMIDSDATPAVPSSKEVKPSSVEMETTNKASESVPDPHEFLSSADAQEFQKQDDEADAEFDTATAAGSSLQTMPSNANPLLQAFASAASTSAATAAARRRAARVDAPFPSDITLPPVASPLSLWAKRLPGQIKAVPPVRGITVLVLIGLAIAVANGAVEGGLQWMMIIEILAVSTAFLSEQISSSSSKKKDASTGKATASRPDATPKASQPAATTSSDADGDVIDVDTDSYRQKPAGGMDLANPFGQLPGMGGMNMKDMNLPPQLDNALKFMQLFMKYAAFMKQLMADATMFIFIVVCISSINMLCDQSSVIHHV